MIHNPFLGYSIHFVNFEVNIILIVIDLSSLKLELYCSEVGILKGCLTIFIVLAFLF